MEGHTIHHRSTRIDALRGVAVIAMIIAHAIFFFHDGTDPLLSNIERLLNMTVFTVFVFVSGLSLSRFLDKTAHIPSRHLIATIAHRFSILYVGYTITAIVAILTSVPALPKETMLHTISQALLLLAPPNFTEYLPLFILLTAAFLLLRPLYHWTRLSFLVTILAGAFAYLLGITLYPLTFPPVISELKTLFAGGGIALRFPVLFYLPVFLLGIWWQHFVDHVTQDKKAFLVRVGVIMGVTAIAITSVIVSFYYYIPALDPGTRWPPSLAYLATGAASAIIIMSVLPSLRWIGAPLRTIVVYFGKDALDLWINHLLFLFLYRKFVGVQFGSLGLVIIAISVLILLSTMLSSVTLTNTVTFPLRFTLQGAMRFRKRYMVFAFLAGLALLVTLSLPTSASTYGNIMLSTPLAVQQKLPNTVALTLATDHTWYARKMSANAVVDISVRAIDPLDNRTLPLNPTVVQLMVGDSIPQLASAQSTDGTIHYSLVASSLPPGTYPVVATITTNSTSLRSNTVMINITEPLLVAWTFDWEGWDVSDTTLSTISDLRRQFVGLRFTHFVSPRTFLEGVLTQQRRKELASYLLAGQAQGDELALHLHMQFDFVQAAGITPRADSPWGLRTEEGYDVPATQYTPEEFRTLLRFSRQSMQIAGLPMTQGYRSGGWFINSQQLRVLAEEGFLYDASGRDRPEKGAFATTPWDLPIGAQPYYPSASDQNIPGSPTGILEIPNNGLATSELTVAQLLQRIAKVYPGNILIAPKTLVFVSHPQFAQSEFVKIPTVLSALENLSLASDHGPIIFVTMSDIAALWKSLQP